MSAGPTLIFFDIATRLGWCEGVPGQRPVFGSYKMRGEDSPAKHADMFRFVAGRFQAFKPRWVFFEAPLSRGQATARLLFGYCAVVEASSRLCGVEDIREIHVETVRKEFLGKGRPKGGSDLKLAVIDECRRLGFDPKNDDEADAIAGWLVTCRIAAPALARQSPFYGTFL
jgi:hypothetical protein